MRLCAKGQCSANGRFSAKGRFSANGRSTVNGRCLSAPGPLTTVPPHGARANKYLSRLEPNASHPSCPKIKKEENWSKF